MRSKFTQCCHASHKCCVTKIQQEIQNATELIRQRQRARPAMNWCQRRQTAAKLHRQPQKTKEHLHLEYNNVAVLPEMVSTQKQQQYTYCKNSLTYSCYTSRPWCHHYVCIYKNIQKKVKLRKQAILIISFL